MSAAWAIFLLLAAETIVPGLYRSHQIEVGAALELSADGKFRYALDYGAVSETGEGKWVRDGPTVRLTSEPMPKAPDFEVIRDDAAPKGELTVRLEAPFAGWSGPIEGYVVTEFGREPYALDLDADGRSGFDSRGIKAIIPEIPVYGGLGSQIPLSSDRGHYLVLRFVPNDLGKARFVDEPLAIDGEALLLRRYDTVIRFTRDD